MQSASTASTATRQELDRLDRQGLDSTLTVDSTAPRQRLDEASTARQLDSQGSMLCMNARKMNVAIGQDLLGMQVVELGKDPDACVHTKLKVQLESCRRPRVRAHPSG